MPPNDPEWSSASGAPTQARFSIESHVYPQRKDRKDREALERGTDGDGISREVTALSGSR